MTRSTYGDCQGDRGAVSTSVIPMPAKRVRRRRNQPVEMDPTLLVRLDLFGYLRPEAG